MPKGKKVGKYELGRVLGSGAFSQVKLGIDETNRKVAVKVIEKEQVIREKLEEQLKLEISIMRSLNHPNIVRLFDVLQTSNNIYIILELVTGGELFDRIVSARRFNEPTARRYFQQLVVALQFCHSQGIAHRDLKPENLLLSDSDNIKITDFGLATMHAPGNPNALEFTLCGTPNYLAPEMLKDQGYIPVMADVWSVGVILYVMLSGSLPFDDPDLPTLFKKIERGQYKVHPGFSDTARDLIARMLTLDPSKRPTLLQVMQHPWFTKDFDRSVWDGLNGITVTTDTTKNNNNNQMNNNTNNQSNVNNQNNSSGSANTYGVGNNNNNNSWEGKQVSEKDTTQAGGVTDHLGAFEIVSQLSMVAMRSMTTNHPIIKISTRFIMGQSAVMCLRSLAEALSGMGIDVKAEGPNDLKAVLDKPKGVISFDISVCSFVDPEICLVEVRRGRGETLEFQDIYRRIVEQLGRLVVSRPMLEEAAP